MYVFMGLYFALFLSELYKRVFPNSVNGSSFLCVNLCLIFF